MKIWLVTTTVNSEPEQKLYLAGAYSTEETAREHQKQLDNPPGSETHIIEMDVDARQPPIVIGQARHSSSEECKKNLPHG